MQKNDEGFPADPVFDQVQTMRTKDPSAEFFGVSNKARQIEESCGLGSGHATAAD
ncbi:MAG: hypothetical protein ACOY3P_00455 [Planctomycetota bacterium]